MKKPIIVTAFWDVGRSKDCAVPRTNERYFEEFRQWARIKNQLIAFANSEDCKKIHSIRKRYGLEELTKTFEIDDVFAIENDIFNRMLLVEEQSSQSKFKYYESAMSNRANFDYAWLIKYWCIFEASKNVDDSDILAWMDFGFNHMDVCYTNMEEFSFEWQTDVDSNKIHLFTLRDANEIPIIDALQLQVDVFMGVIHIVPVQLARKFWTLVKQAMCSLLMLGIIDDDQMLLLMAFRYEPGIFEVHNSSWFMPLKECGASHLTVKQNNKSLFRAIIEKTVSSYKYIHRFGCNSKNRAKRYYGISMSGIKRYIKNYFR